MVSTGSSCTLTLGQATHALWHALVGHQSLIWKHPLQFVLFGMLHCTSYVAQIKGRGQWKEKEQKNPLERARCPMARLTKPFLQEEHSLNPPIQCICY